MPLSLIRGLLTFTFFTLAISGCSEKVEDWCETNSDCQGLIEKGIVTAADVQCHPHDHLCYPGCKTTADCAAYPGTICHEGDCWKQSRWEDVGVPDKGKDMGADQTQDVEPDGGQDILPPDTVPPDMERHRLAGESCAGPLPCTDGLSCVNDVCCKESSCPDCQTCKQQGDSPDAKDGTCVPDPDQENENPNGACGKDSDPCHGLCKDGACSYSGTTTCDQRCSGGDLILTKCAPDANACTVDQPKTACAPYKCDGSPAACATFCTEHSDCVTGMCDRTEAQADGQGRCVPADEILGPDPATSANLEALVKQATTKRTTVRLKPVLYGSRLTVASGEVRLIAPQPGTQLAGLSVGAGAKVFVQGVSISAAVPSPVECKTLSTAQLTIVESTISDGGSAHPGIIAQNCSVTLRRSRVEKNDGGGLDLSKGAFVLTNNLIVGNGTTSADLGGVLFSTPTSVTFVNNTVAKNSAANGNAGGVVCPLTATVTLRNSVLDQNTGAAHIGKCTLTDTNIDGTCNLDTAYKPTVGACFDKAAPTTVTGLVWDFDRTPRVKGGSVDLGAYEIK